MPVRTQAFLSVTALAIALCGCAVGPDYQRPSTPMPVAFKQSKDWKVSQPASVDNGPWWAYFNDPVLDQLEREVTVNSQNILQYEAATRAAAATADIANAALFPTLGVTAGASRAKTPALRGASVGTTVSVGAEASWAIDVWGKLRRSLEAADANAIASADQLAAAKLNIQATLASDYFALRAADELQRLLNATVTAYEKSLQITRNQYRAGTSNKADVDQAETQLETTRSQAINVESTRVQLENAIAVLLGKAPSDFALPPVEGLAAAPQIPVALPSELLERRPDIAAAEKQMQAANAQIGVAIAAYFPTLSLTASTDNSSSAIGNLFKASSNVWSFGPQLAATVIDWGARDAQIAQAHANYDQQVAIYRQTVLSAFQQVEDDMVSLTHLARQSEVESRAVASSSEAERLIFNQYKAGTVAYTSVVTAQTAALSARQSELTIRQNQLTTAVALLQALGGGWRNEAVTAAAP
jgi:NodT family efflux transporter outer membrane factor (OMF) lipoprotein